MSELHELSATDLAKALHTGATSPVDVARHFLDRIDHFNEQLGAFATVTHERAIQRAESVTHDDPAERPLWGMPVGDKDLWHRRGVRTTFGSMMFSDYVPEFSDDPVKEIDAAGAVSLGKTTAPEFGLPAYTEPISGPIARNPWDLSRTAGGSSGGAAVAVAAGLLPFAPGSDGGGSVRIPAACCGLVGIKPSRGRVPSGSGLDTFGQLIVNGPLARSVEDAAFLLDAMIAPRGSAHHRFAVRAPELPTTLQAAARDASGTFRIAVLSQSPWSPDYRIQIEEAPLATLSLATTYLAALGHNLVDINLPNTDDFATQFRVIWQAGAAPIPVVEDNLDALEPLTAWLIARGRALGALDVAKALRYLAEFERGLISHFEGYDAVLTPALGKLPPPIGSFDAEDAELNFAQQTEFTPFTAMANVAGLPALTLPISHDGSGLPVGVQLIGRPGGEDALVRIAAQLEDETGLAGVAAPGYP